MKRITTIGAVVVAFAVAPSVATAGGVSAQVRQQISAEAIGVQTSKVERAQVAVSVQRHVVLVAQSKRIATTLRWQLR
jgi:hypothetical protein